MNKYSDLASRSKLYISQEASKSPSQMQKKVLTCLPSLKLSYSKSTVTSPTSVSPPINNRSQTETLSGISQLSHLSNKGFPNLSVISPRLSLKLPALELSSLHKCDFSPILEQIETIAGPKRKRVLLYEGKTETNTLTPKSSIFFCIKTKGKKTPLTVSLFEFKDSVTVYVSWTEQWPRPEVHENVFEANNFVLSEPNSEFEAEQVFLGVFSESECEFEIQVAFGKSDTLKGRKGKSDEDSLDDNILIGNAKGHRPTVKNFIQANRKTLSPVLKNKDGDSEWVKKKANAALRRKILVKEKKLKTIENLHKQIFNAEIKEIIRKDREKLETFEWVLKKIVGLAYFLRSVGKIRTVIRAAREHKLRIIEKKVKMTRIQKCVKQKFLTSSFSSLALASRSLKLYRKTIKDWFLHQTNESLIKIIAQKAKDNYFIHQIRNFRLKVLRIQRLCRKNCRIRALHMNKLESFWNNCVERLLVKKNSNKQHKQMSLTMKYKGIPTTARTRVLKEFYYGCWRMFREEIKSFYFEHRKIKEAKFKYMPTESKMKEMIQTLLKKI